MYDDVTETLLKIKNKNKILAITTGAPKQIAQMEINLLPNLFSRAISVTSTRYKNKPHPESLIACMRQLKATSNQTVYVGNSIDDKLYSAAAGVDFIYIERQEHQIQGQIRTKIHSLVDLVS